MKYLKLFETAAAFEVARATLDLPNVSLIEATNGLNYLPYVAPAPHNYANDYLTLVAIDDCYFEYNTTQGELSYSLDNGTTWSEYSSYSTFGYTVNENTIYVAAGNKVLFKGRNTSCFGGSCGTDRLFSIDDYYIDDNEETQNIESQQRFSVEGNIMSLLYGDNFIGQTSFLNDEDKFAGLFTYLTNLISAENLILPATTLTEGCYAHMFEGCSSLTVAPKLPATTLSYYCYDSMFTDCISLTTAPILPATILAKSCYYFMFSGCTSLNYVKCLATDISASACTYSWLYNVAQTGTVVKDANMTDWETSESGIPEGWTVQDYTE